MSIHKRLIAPILVIIITLCWPTTSSSWADFSVSMPATIVNTTLGRQINLMRTELTRNILEQPAVENQFGFTVRHSAMSVSPESKNNKLPEISSTISELYQFISQG
ncbi:MAG: hypothetical protein ACI9CF_000321 [Candidatus Omnitrophota bacterium]|jgi:hypothetical protein